VAGERILVVDDSVEIQDIIRDLILRPAGYRVLQAMDGPEGLRLALQEQPDLILLDLQLPGLSGLQILQALGERGVAIPVILMTAHGSQEVAVQALRLGVRDYVIKPFEPAEMATAIDRALAESRLRQERDGLIDQLEKANQRLQQQVQEMNTLRSIGQSVAALLDLETVLKRVVEAAVFLTHAEEGLLLLLEPESGDLVLRAAKNIDESQAHGLRIRVQDSLAGQVMRSGEPLLIAEGQPKVATGYLVNSLVYVPLRGRERGVIGILGVTNRRVDRAFTPRDVRLLAALADQAAIALENARLYQEVEAARHRLEAVLLEIEEAVVILDPDLSILLCNPAAGAALEFTCPVVGAPALQVVRLSALQELISRGARSGEALRAEVEGRSGRMYDAQIRPVEGVGYVLTMQDITHFKELDRVKSEFVAMVSHDLRTPLTTIRGYVDLLEKVGPLNETQMQFIGRVRDSMEHIIGLISTLLDLGRIEAGYDLEMEPLHLESIIDAVVDEFMPQAEQKGLTLRWKRQPLPLVRGSPQRLRQVMENLLSNAIKYTNPGGWVAVEAAQDGEHVVVHVSDNGIGIPLAEQPFIFDRFYRVRAGETEQVEGTGLGLSIVRSVIEKHGGRVWVDSRPGEGSTFSFVLHAME